MCDKIELISREESMKKLYEEKPELKEAMENPDPIFELEEFILKLKMNNNISEEKLKYKLGEMLLNKIRRSYTEIPMEDIKEKLEELK